MILFFFSFVSKKEVRHCYRGGGYHVFFAKLYLKFILYFRVREYLKFSVRHRTDRMQISASPTKKLVVLQFVKLLTTKDD